MSKSRFHLVTPSRWLMREVDSTLTGECVVSRTIIPNGVDLSVFRPASQSVARERLRLPANARIVLFAHPMAKASEFKDYPTFARCAALLRDRWPADRLLFIAVGPSLANDDLPYSRIQFVPRVNDRQRMADFYRAADVYLHPARAENFPLAVLEAMACGKPVVASRVGGIPEQVVDGESGLLADSGDAEGMAHCLERILSDADLANRLGRAGLERAQRLYGLGDMTNMYLRLMESAIMESVIHEGSDIAV